MNCDKCKFAIHSGVVGRYRIENRFSGCGHTDNIKKRKTDIVTGRITITLKEKKIHFKWNKNLDCGRYEPPPPPPKLFGE